jgi:hypothetical protein
MGSLDYLATWLAWERDSEKRGQDAAASWKLANIQTWECCSMGYCDNLLTTLEALLAATTALECCGEQDITDGKQYTDEVEDGVGDVPQNIIDAGYADDAADWDGFDDYKCMISHLAVDHVESFFRQIAPHISDTGIVIGGVGVVGALIGAILTVVGLPISAGIIIALGAAAAIWTWITSEGRDAVEDLADEIAAEHDALACAIYSGDGVTQSVINFNNKVDELFSPLNEVAIRAINIEPQLRAMYAGRYDQEDIAAKLAELEYDVLSYDCTCPDEPPPSGYKVIYPQYMQFINFNGCTDTGTSWDPSTGLLTLDFNATAGNWKVQFRIREAAGGGGLGWLSHGWVFDLLSLLSPTAIPRFQWGAPVAQMRFDFDVGEAWSGYNTAAHPGSPAEWEDWVAQYHFVRNTSSGFEYIDLFHTGAGTVGAHKIICRVKIVVPV